VDPDADQADLAALAAGCNQSGQETGSVTEKTAEGR